MKRLPVELGSVVISKAGRYAGRRFLVVEEVDADFVLVANGRLRKMDRLKKKRRKHLQPTGHRRPGQCLCRTQLWRRVQSSLRR